MNETESNEKKAFLINLGFLLFIGFFIEICRVVENDGEFSVSAWLFECLIIFLLGCVGAIMALFRKVVLLLIVVAVLAILFGLFVRSH